MERTPRDSGRGGGAAERGGDSMHEGTEASERNKIRRGRSGECANRDETPRQAPSRRQEGSEKRHGEEERGGEEAARGTQKSDAMRKGADVSNAQSAWDRREEQGIALRTCRKRQGMESNEKTTRREWERQ